MGNSSFPGPALWNLPISKWLCIRVLFFKADGKAASGLIVSAAAFLLFFRCLVVFFENKIPNPAL